MAQGRQQNNGSRQRCAQSAAAKAPAEPPKAVCAQLEQMNRKLAAASAEILRYQTRLFACERQMAALRQENAQLEAACEQARQEAECAGAHAEQLRQELARHAEKAGADATSAVPSVYYRLGEESVYRHWTAITEAADLPFFIYNIPQLTGFNLSMGLFGRMLANERVAGVKCSSEPCHDILRFKQAGGEDFIVFSGSDEQYLAGRLMGADGGIGGTYGPMPELYMKLEEYICAGEIEKARRLQEKILFFITACALPSMYGAK